MRRPGVTDMIHRLEGDGLIRSTRGIVTIRDRAGLEALAGDTYGVAEREYRELIGDLGERSGVDRVAQPSRYAGPPAVRSPEERMARSTV